jgi:hypothetical protein
VPWQTVELRALQGAHSKWTDSPAELDKATLPGMKIPGPPAYVHTLATPERREKEARQHFLTVSVESEWAGGTFHSLLQAAQLLADIGRGWHLQALRK